MLCLRGHPLRPCREGVTPLGNYNLAFTLSFPSLTTATSTSWT
jgi:hypothetical protein